VKNNAAGSAEDDEDEDDICAWDAARAVESALLASERFLTGGTYRSRLRALAAALRREENRDTVLHLRDARELDEKKKNRKEGEGEGRWEEENDDDNKSNGEKNEDTIPEVIDAHGVERGGGRERGGRGERGGGGRDSGGSGGGGESIGASLAAAATAVVAMDRESLASAAIRAAIAASERRREREAEVEARGGAAIETGLTCPSCRTNPGRCVRHHFMSGGTYAEERQMVESITCLDCGNKWRTFDARDDKAFG